MKINREMRRQVNEQRMASAGFITLEGEYLLTCKECGKKHSHRRPGLMFLHQMRQHPEASQKASEANTARLNALLASYEASKVQG